MTETIKDKDVVLRAYALFDRGTAFHRLLPISLSNGATVNHFAVSCAGCRMKLGNDELRGTIDRVADGVLLAEGIAHCSPCNLLTPFRVHIKPHGDGFRIESLEHVPLLQSQPGSLISLDAWRNRSNA